MVLDTSYSYTWKPKEELSLRLSLHYKIVCFIEESLLLETINFGRMEKIPSIRLHQMLRILRHELS